jgi:hypothetical protein
VARKRMIDPEFFLDEDLAKLSAHARLLYIGLWGIADDNVFTVPNRPEWIKAQVLPYEDIDINVLLNELMKKEKIVLFDYPGCEEYSKGQYYYIKNMGKYQRIERPSKQKFPEYSPSTQVVLTEQSVNTRSEVKLSKDNINKGVVSEFFNYFLLKTKKTYKLNGARRAVIESRLKDHTLDELKKAVDNFVKDDWPDRHKYTDIVYCIGVRNKIDNLEKWLNYQPKQSERRVIA